MASGSAGGPIRACGIYPAVWFGISIGLMSWK
jgi:hypothetical protein